MLHFPFSRVIVSNVLGKSTKSQPTFIEVSLKSSITIVELLISSKDELEKRIY